MNNEDIIKAAGRIMARSGAVGLTVDALHQEPELVENELLKEINNENEIFELMLRHLERELKYRVNAISAQSEPPEKEISHLFNNLYDLFKQNPWYPHLIFDPEVSARCTKAGEIIFRVKRVAKNYLVGLVKQPQQKNIHAPPGGSRQVSRRHRKRLPDERWQANGTGKME
ncbi:MAG: hypothetical protein PHT26_15470 [Lentimicrobiaceae bacterium]|nr:hypothetical protein [Lentimicrobiaceae bacterium]